MLVFTANVRFHVIEPLVALARLVHIRIALLFFVSGGCRRVDNGGAHNRSPAYLETIFRQANIDQSKQFIAEVVLFHQVTEFTNRRFIWNQFLCRFDTHKSEYCSKINKGFFW